MSEERRDEGSEHSATGRADELLNRLGQTAGVYGSLVSRRFSRVASFVREEAEDMWAEAQSMRRQNAGAEPGEDASVRTSEEIGTPRREADEHEAEQEAEPKERAKNSEYVIRTGDYVGAADRKEEESDAVSGQETESHGEDGTTPAPEKGPREEIRSIIRESVRRSQEGIREEEEPQDGTTPAPEEGRADAEEPPVEDYDSLSVGQVNQRLLELSVEEVEQLRDYEAAHRNRPSIMNRYERRLRVARENRQGGGAAGAAESSAGGEG